MSATAMHTQPQSQRSRWSTWTGGVVTAVVAVVFFTHVFTGYSVLPRQICLIADVSRQGMDSGAVDSSERRQVLLVTYGRSGSSFTSGIIQKDPDVFYFFEPLLTLFKMFKENQTTGTDRYPESYQILKSYLTDCDPRNGSVIHNHLYLNSEDTSDAYNCLIKESKGFEHLSCYYEMLKKCLQRKVTLVKTIRFRLGWTEKLLLELPNLKILYLIRDPRAVLYSQARVLERFDWTNQTETRLNSKEHCQNVKDDLEILRHISKLFPGRIKAIRYEDGAQHPLDYAKGIYEFLELDFTKDIEDFILSLTHAAVDKRGDNSFSLYTHDAVSQSQQWRHTAGHESVAIVDEICGQLLYTILGYRRVWDQQDLMGNVSLVMDPGVQDNIF